MIPVTRTIKGNGRHADAGHMYHFATHRRWRPGNGGAPYMTGPVQQVAVQQSVPGSMPFSGMDPSDPSTWVRPWNPQPGMVGRLNYDGAQTQGNSDMGGLWSNPASWNARAGRRPKRRPR